MADLSRASSQTVTPAVAPATSGPSAALAAPQLTGNAAAQDRLGLAGALPSAADTLEMALAGMGAMASVVLDAMPSPQAFGLAARNAPSPWAKAWLSDQPAKDLVKYAAEALHAGLDVVWPVGLGVAVDASVSAAAVVKGVGMAGAEIARSAEGMMLTRRGETKGGLAFGEGAKLSGANDDTALGGGMDANFLGGGTIEETFLLPLEDVFAELATLTPATVGALLLGVGTPMGMLPAMVALAARLKPVSRSVDLRARADAATSKSVPGMAHEELGAAFDAGVTLGQEGGATYVEVSSSGGSARESWALLDPIAAAMGMPVSMFTWDIGVALRLRVTGTPEAIAAGDTDALDFLIGVTRTDSEGSIEDIFETSDAKAAGRFLLAVACAVPDALMAALGEEGPAVPAAELPDVTLTRSATRSVDDVSTLIDGAAPIAKELVALAAPDEHAFLTQTYSAELEATLRVPVDAVRAALHGAALPTGPEGAEARVLDVARFLADRAVGQTGSLPEGLPALDLAAGLVRVAVPKVGARVEWTSRVGLGGEVEVLASAELGATAGITLVRDGELSPAIDAEQRRALFAD